MHQRSIYPLSGSCRCRHWCACLAALAVTGANAVSTAQEFFGPSRLPSSTVDAGRPSQDVFQLISRLKSTLNSGANGPDDPAAGGPPLGNPGEPSSTVPPSTLPTEHSETIRQKLDLLRSLIQSRESGALASPGTTRTAPPAAYQPPAGGAALPHSAPLNHAGGSAESPPESPGTHHGAPDAPSGEVPVSGINALEAPVDPLELAFSLFATGNHEAALKTLREIQPRITDHNDRQWLDYFIASSQRLGGQRDEAEGAYRLLTNGRQEGYPVSAAEWWMTWMQRRKQTEAAAADVMAALEQFQNQEGSHGDNH